MWRNDVVLATYEYVTHQRRELDSFIDSFKEENRYNLTTIPERPWACLFSELTTGRPFRFVVLNESENEGKNVNSAFNRAFWQVPRAGVLMLSASPMKSRWTDIHGCGLSHQKGHPFTRQEEFESYFYNRSKKNKAFSPVLQKNRLIKYLMAVSFGRPSTILNFPDAESSTGANLDARLSEAHGRKDEQIREIMTHIIRYDHETPNILPISSEEQDASDEAV